MVTRETDLLGQIIGQDIDEIAIAALVEEGLIRKFRVFVRETRGRFGVLRRRRGAD